MTASKWPPDGYPSQPEPPQATPSEPRVIVQLIGPDHPNHPINRAKREAEAVQKAAEEAAAAQAAAEAAAAAQPTDPPKKRRKRRSRRRVRAPQPEIPANESRLERHQRCCAICNHDEREEINQEFLDWIHPDDIESHYDVDWRALYRHAHATGLFAARQRNLRAALGHIIEKACWVDPTVDGLLRAMRAYSSLDREGRWTEIPTHVVVSSGAQLAHSSLIGESLKTLTLRSVSQPEPAADEPQVTASGATPEPSENAVLLDNEKK